MAYAPVIDISPFIKRPPQGEQNDAEASADSHGGALRSAELRQ